MLAPEPEFYKTRGRWWWRMRASTGLVLAKSPRGYKRRATAEQWAFVAANRLALWGVRGLL